MNKVWLVIIIFLTVVVQISFYFEYLTRIIPDLSLLLMLLYAFNGEEKEEAATLAVTVGLFQDLLIGRALGVYALAKLLVVYWGGWLGEKELFEDNTVVLFFTLLVFNLIYWALLWFIFITSFQVEIIFHRYLGDHLFTQSVLTGILGVLLNPGIKSVVKKQGHLFPYR